MSEKRQYRRYTEDEKAAALADVVLIGTSAAAAKYGLPRSTLTTWQEIFAVVHNPVIKKDRIGQLVLAYLEANLQALIAQSYVVSQPEYIERQPADGIAILHGVMADKSVRLLEALHGSQPESPSLDADSVHREDAD